jgi:hypothetical protein
MRKLFLGNLILFLLAACQNTPLTPASSSTTPTQTATRNIEKNTQEREPKHPLILEFTPVPTRTHKPTPIPELIGTFSLLFEENPTPETAYFDFDIGDFNPSLEENDIVAGLAIGTNIFGVIHPLGEARQHTGNKKDGLDFDYELCNGSYGKGGVPINDNSLYCWHTNEGHLVQLRIVRIEDGNLEHGWWVYFEYALWSQ